MRFLKALLQRARCAFNNHPPLLVIRRKVRGKRIKMLRCPACHKTEFTLE